MIDNTPPPFALTQRRWRIAGLVALGLCALMAWYGVDHMLRHPSLWMMLGYWGLFLILLVAAMLSVWLDVRFIKLQYALGRRTLFEDTLGSEEFRRALQTARQEAAEKEKETP